MRYLSLCLSLSLTATAVSRTWTDVTGRELEASFVEAKSDSVVVKRDDNESLVEIPLARLSDADLTFVGQQKETSESGTTEVADADPAPKADDGEPANWGKPWPDSVKLTKEVTITVAKEDEDERQFIYQSDHYEFVCDVRLASSVVSQFASLFEATREYMRELPINSRLAFKKTGVDRFRILLFEKESSYYENGGPQGSAGVFMSGRGRNFIMVPLTSLGVKAVGSGYMLDRSKSNRTLPHEITHQLTDYPYYAPGSRGWFTEGLAEYVSATPYRSGRFDIKGVERDIREYVTSYDRKTYSGRNLSDTLDCPNLKDYMLMSYSDFRENGNFNYGLGALLVTYFFHWDDDGSRKPITAFLKALKEGKKGEKAVAVLLNGRSFDEMEELIASAWKSKGVTLRFR